VGGRAPRAVGRYGELLEQGDLVEHETMGRGIIQGGPHGPCLYDVLWAQASYVMDDPMTRHHRSALKRVSVIEALADLVGTQ
jgi:hypothetical protein